MGNDSGSREMQVIRSAVPPPASAANEIKLFAGRAELSKRRWRGIAEDGREFGFDLETPLGDGAPFFDEDGAVYAIAQKPEPVLEIAVSAAAAAAHLGWSLGNLHFQIQIDGDLIRVTDDPAVCELLTRDRIPFSRALRVFHPLKSAGHHHH